MDLTTVLASIVVVGIAFVMIATRILLVKNGEFRGSCASNNPMLKNEIGECTVCGRMPGEECNGDEAGKTDN